ncbi:MAG TPA: glycosyltransferase family 4 protein [Chitinispirillaceae bacterium]|nr:glycosyltransferase family 4 protein [Chitinispirillaceae bacterium]
MQQFGFNVIGFISGNLGQGTAARSTIKILLGKDLPVSVIDVDAGFGRSGFDNSFNYLNQSADRQAPYAVNLIQLNPPEISQLLKQKLPCLTDPTKLNIIVPFWELPRLPQSWIPVLEKMDMILAPTHFIEYMMSTQVQGVPVRHYPQTISIPDTIVPNRVALNLPEDKVLFVTSFEMFSDINRKNTWAVIEAFEQAFPDDTNVNLIVKVNNAAHTAFAAELEKLRTFSVKNSRIILLEKSLSYPDVLSLYASCDILISLHRAEGLGLSPMEAMFLGKPVIATGWSGNMDFMNDENSCLVPSTLVPVISNAQSGYNPAYIGGSTIWAQPNIDIAVFWMQQLACDPLLRQKIGKNAYTSITERHAECCKGDVFNSIGSFYEHHRDMLKTGVKKKSPAQAANTSQNLLINSSQSQQINDLHSFVEHIVQLIENGHLRNALSIYDNRRGSFGDSDSQLQHIDEIISRLRMKIS